MNSGVGSKHTVSSLLVTSFWHLASHLLSQNLPSTLVSQRFTTVAENLVILKGVML
jgi:hypothetical protein